MNIMKFNWQWTTAWISLIWLRAGHQVNWTAARLIFPARFDHLHESLFIQFSLKHFGPKEIMIKNVLISIFRHNWIYQSLDSGLLPQASFYTDTGNGTYSNVVVSFRNQISLSHAHIGLLQTFLNSNFLTSIPDLLYVTPLRILIKILQLNFHSQSTFLKCTIAI